MNKKHKLSLFVLFIVMILGFCISASAANDKAVSIGKKNYATIQDALNVVKKGQTITLQRGINMQKKKLTARRNVEYTIDFNQKKITNCGGFEIKAGSVTLKNGIFRAHKEIIEPWGDLVYDKLTVGKKAKVTLSRMECSADLYVQKGGTLTINKGVFHKASLSNDGTTKIKNAVFENWQVIMNTGKMSINKGTYDIKGAFDTGWCILNEKGTLNISSGEFLLTPGDDSIMNFGRLKIKRDMYKKLKKNLDNCGRVSLTNK